MATLTVAAIEKIKVTGFTKKGKGKRQRQGGKERTRLEYHDGGVPFPTASLPPRRRPEWRFHDLRGRSARRARRTTTHIGSLTSLHLLDVRQLPSLVIKRLFRCRH